MIRRPPRSTHCISSAASDVYKRQLVDPGIIKNFYELNLYRGAIDEGKFPIYRGLKMNSDDVIRREVIRHIRTFFNVEFDFFNKKYKMDFKDYFKKELVNLLPLQDDQLLKINNSNIILSELGEHLSPQVANVFDAYNDQKFYDCLLYTSPSPRD